jgi:hypothetical protein
VGRAIAPAPSSGIAHTRQTLRVETTIDFIAEVASGWGRCYLAQSPLQHVDQDIAFPELALVVASIPAAEIN